MQNTVLLIIILILLTGFITNLVLEYLNASRWTELLPEKLKGICSDEEYRRSQFYKRDNTRLSLLSSAVNLVAIILMFVSGGFAFADKIARAISGNEIVISLAFFAIIGLASDILNMPFAIWDTFVIEKKYGFNTMTVRIFITDHLKSWFLALLVGGPVLGALTFLFYSLGSGFWIYAWIVITVFSVFINFFYSELIVPLFNRQTPLQTGVLREQIEEFAKKAGFRLRDIYVIDGSKRSTKANAYFSGFGPKKRIVLYDTLEKELSAEEIVAVLGHEIGHYRKKHVLMRLGSSVLVTGLMLWLFSLIAGNPAFSLVPGIQKPAFHIALVVFGVLYSPLSLVLGLASNYISRKHEFEADNFARQYGMNSSLGSALKKLAVSNLSNMMPHPAYVFFHYSHPPLLDRLRKLE